MKKYRVAGKFKSGRDFKVEVWSRSGNKIDVWDWSKANGGYSKSHKHHYGTYGKKGYHKSLCEDYHRTDGRWYCDRCRRHHNGPWGRDFAGVGPSNGYGLVVDKYLDISEA